MELFYTTKQEANKLWLQGAEAQHCTRVLRHKAGDTVFVTDGEGHIFRSVIEKIDKELIECEIQETSLGIGERKYSLTMAVCPTKNLERYEWFVEKATELGVDRFVPIISDHSIRTALKLERLKNIALSAMKQSLKAYLPEVCEPVKVADFLKRFQENRNALKLIAHCEEGEKIILREALKLSDKPQIIILIGPEGDFSAKEIVAAQEAGFQPITLGSSRLRVETAALASVCEVYFTKNT